jgi:hypothetical protein
LPRRAGPTRFARVNPTPSGTSYETPLAPMDRSNRGRRRRWVLLLVWLALGCRAAPRSPAAESPSDAESSCGAEWLALEPGPERELGSARIVLRATASRAAIVAAMEREVPDVVASARGLSIGAPGTLSYVVRRGEPRFGVAQGELSVAVPLLASIQVCKPLFGMCPVYGRCNASVEIHARTPARLEEGWQLPRPELESRIVRGCLLEPVGLNVTSELQRTVQRELAAARGQIAARTEQANRDLKSLVGEQVRTLTRDPLFDPPNQSCLRIERLSPLPLDAEANTFSSGLEVAGKLVPSETACTPTHPEFGAQRAEVGDPHSAFSLIEEVSLEAWREAMNRSLRTSMPRNAAVTLVTRLDVGLDRGQARVALHLRGGSCTDDVIAATPLWIGDGLGLANLTASSSSLSRELRSRLGGIRYSPASSAGAGPLAARFDRWLAAFAAVVAERTGLRPRLETEWQPARVMGVAVFGRSLWLRSTVSARLGVHLE